MVQRGTCERAGRRAIAPGRMAACQWPFQAALLLLLLRRRRRLLLLRLLLQRLLRRRPVYLRAWAAVTGSMQAQAHRPCIVQKKARRRG